MSNKIAETVVSSLLDDFREFQDFVPYWVSPGAEIHHAVPGGHIPWARNNILGMDTIADGTLDAMRQKHWLRMVVRHAEVWVDAYRATQRQLKAVKDWAIEHHKKVFDEVSQRPVDEF